ncbi:hypothetical protein FF011L_38260 [Roseimaritima multifibrata]|uniref:Uncharacterized protein n=1 Tax=Roseimaritima multifibrata TaxID=1930274 RepID=A0A517MJH0_9BACT|nr:hypothetical protein [Roseimaritima multifibrata]QDS95042.1 hypothetical protein FF011L_38260 [Roseimaritima multifibrata]
MPPLKTFWPRYVTTVLCVLGLLLTTPVIAQQNELQGNSKSESDSKKPASHERWITQQDENGNIQVRHLTLHSAAEPRPALRYQLIPDAFHAKPGNSAIYYLKAMGFLEQHNAQEKLTQIFRQAHQKASEAGIQQNLLEPYVWEDMPPDQLPLEEVKEYLSLTSFQAELLKEAAARRDFDLERNLQDVDSVIGYLLPEIQGMRQLARTNSIRSRVAIAEERYDDAMETIGQQFALGRHLGQDDFFVSNLVGVAIASIGWSDLLSLQEQTNAPSLYWALASLPAPLVDTGRAEAVERKILYEEFITFKRVTEAPQPAGYWQAWVKDLADERFEWMLEISDPGPELRRTALVAAIATSYPSAKKYLIEELGFDPKQVEAYPTAQVVSLATVKFYDFWRDEFYKWHCLPYWQVTESSDANSVERRFRDACKNAGWFSKPTEQLLPALFAFRSAQVRAQQQIAMAQTVEAIRLHLHQHDGNFPESLADLSFPAPLDPANNQPFQYERAGETFVLEGQSLSNRRTRLVLHNAP